MTLGIFIFGSGGHSNSCVELVEQHSGFVLSGFVCSVVNEVHNNNSQNLRVHSESEIFESPNKFQKKFGFTLGFGARNPDGLKKRSQLFFKLVSKGFHVPVLIHPQAIVAMKTDIAAGVQVFAGSRVGPHSEVGPNTIINTGSIVEHDVSIGSGCFVAPGAILLGNCVLDDHVFVGAGAIVLPGALVPKHTFIKAGSIYKGDKNG